MKCFSSFFQSPKTCHCVFLRSELLNRIRMVNPGRALCHKETVPCFSSFLELVPSFPSQCDTGSASHNPALGPFALPGSETLICSSHGCGEGGMFSGKRNDWRTEEGEKCQEFHAIHCRTNPLLLFRAFSSWEKLL